MKRRGLLRRWKNAEGLSSVPRFLTTEADCTNVQTETM